jgi:hypothetical protein
MTSTAELDPIRGDLYTREWVVDETQRTDENGNLMWHKHLKKEQKEGKPPRRILNFPAGGYWKYTAKDPETRPLTKLRHPMAYYDVELKKKVDLKKQYTKKDQDIEDHAKDIIRQRKLDDIAPQYDTWRKEYWDPMEGSFEEFASQVDADWSREAPFEGAPGFIATRTAEGGILPGSLLDTAPAGYYWKRDAEGNDIWVDGKRVPAPLYEGRGLTRPGKKGIEERGRGSTKKTTDLEKIQERLAETYIQNDSYIHQLAIKYAPDTTGKNYSALPPQTPIGQDDLEREDGGKLTRDWTMENIQSIDPDTGTMGDPLARWALSSEGQRVEAERKKEFNRYMFSNFEKEQAEHKGTFMEGKTKPWGFFGIKYGATAQDWENMEREKKKLYAQYEAEHLASIKPALDLPGTTQVGDKIVQENGVVLDDRGRPTGEVQPVPDADTDDDSDIDDDDPELLAMMAGVGRVNIEQDEEEDEFMDDADTYGRRITSGRGGTGLSGQRDRIRR